MNKRTRLLFYISAILLTGCNSNNNADLDNNKALTAGYVSDTLLVESDIVIKESFIKETLVQRQPAGLAKSHCTN